MASTYRYHDMGTPTLRTKFTYSIWLKRSKLGAIGTIASMWKDGNNHVVLRFNSNDTLVFYDYSSSSMITEVATNAVFRDTNAWYNIVVAFDSTQGTAADRTKLYVNGVQQTSLGTATYGAQNNTPASNVSGTDNYLGARGDGHNYGGLMSHCHFVDGAVYQASTFGSTDATTGEWKINTSPTITEYGTNGWFMFKDDASLTDRSGKSNNFTNQSGTLTQTEDNPSNVFPVFNVILRMAAGLNVDQGNLYSGGCGANKWRSLYFTQAAKTGKYYHEMKVIGNSGNNYQQIGLTDVDQFNSGVDEYNFQNNSRGYSYNQNGQKSNNNSSASYGDSFTTNDIIGVATDLTNGKIYFSKNGTWQDSGDPTSGSTGTGAAYSLAAGYWYSPCFAIYGAADNQSYNMGNGYFRTNAVASAGTNASGLGIFEYDVPAGYSAWCTKGYNE